MADEFVEEWNRVPMEPIRNLISSKLRKLGTFRVFGRGSTQIIKFSSYQLFGVL